MRMRTVPGAVALAALMAGCGGSNAPASRTATTRTHAPAATTAGGSAPRRVGTFTGSFFASSTTTAAPRATASRTSRTTTPPAGPRPARAHFDVALRLAADGALAPPSVSVAGGVTIQLTVRNASGSAHELTVGGGGPTVEVAAHGRASVTLPRLANAAYALLVDGRPRGLLVVGARPGP